MVSGVAEAGFRITGQPAASAGPILRVAIAAGKFHGVTSTAIPAGLMSDQDARAGRRPAIKVADRPHRLFAAPAEELRGIGDLAARIRQRLAVLQRDQAGELLLLRHDQLERLAQHLAALARLRRGPGGKRLLGGVERRACRPRPSRSRPSAIMSPVAGIVDLERLAVGGVAPFASQKKLRRNILNGGALHLIHLRSSAML